MKYSWLFSNWQNQLSHLWVQTIKTKPVGSAFTSQKYHRRFTLQSGELSKKSKIRYANVSFFALSFPHSRITLSFFFLFSFLFFKANIQSCLPFLYYERGKANSCNFCWLETSQRLALEKRCFKWYRCIFYRNFSS